jgi:hypothetical protein
MKGCEGKLNGEVCPYTDCLRKGKPDPIIPRFEFGKGCHDRITGYSKAFVKEGK